MTGNFSAFFQLRKIDEEKRLIWGQITSEVADKSGEVMDYASSKPLFEEWSSDIAKASGGKSVGNVRVMHGKSVAGKLTSIAFDDGAKAINGCAKIVDDGEWAKVREGCYTGFSIGGSYEKRWPDETNPELTRFTARPVEVSLVDLPCCPTATFSAIKADGSEEMRKFTSPAPREPGNDEIAAKARELAKAAGDEAKWADHIEAARAELAKAIEPARAPAAPVQKTVDPATLELKQFWHATDGTPFARKADALAHSAALLTKAPSPALAALDRAEAALEKKDYSDDDRKKMAESGEAMDDGGYPIKTRADLKNAVQAFGRAKDPAATKKHIIARAKALDATDLLPADWSGSTKSDKGAAIGALRKDNVGAGPEASDHDALAAKHRDAAKDFRKKADGAAGEGNATLAGEHREKAGAHDKAADAHARASKLQADGHPDAEKAGKEADALTGAANKKTGTALKAARTDALAKRADELAKWIGEEVWDAGNALSALGTLFSLLSGELVEGEDDPAQTEALRAAIARLKDFIVSEIQEDNDPDADDALAMAAKSHLRKAGARNSSSDKKHIQALHDHSVALGADCGNADKHAHGGDLAKGGDLEKITAERDAAKAELAEIVPRMEKLAARIEEIGAQPVPPPMLAGTRAVAKGGEAGGAEDIEAQLAKMPAERIAAMLIKISQQQPIPVTQVGGLR